MYIFDTDHLSFIQRNEQEGKQVLAKLSTLQNPEVAVTIITYEEQIRAPALMQNLFSFRKHGLENCRDRSH